MPLALIDADIVAHRIGFTTENDDVGIARWRCDEMMEGILYETGASHFMSWFSDSRENNFRTGLYSAYKANRTQPKPRHHEALKEHLIVEWGTRIAYGMEADDSLGIAQVADSGHYEDYPVICSIDKDLMQIPGEHYNFVKKEHRFVKESEAVYNFYAQILVGDTSDNVQGCRGIGPVKAQKALEGIVSEKDYISKVFETYTKQEGKERKEEEILRHILLVGRLLKIKQYEDEPLWHFPLYDLTGPIFQ